MPLQRHSHESNRLPPSASSNSSSVEGYLAASDLSLIQDVYRSLPPILRRGWLRRSVSLIQMIVVEDEFSLRQSLVPTSKFQDSASALTLSRFQFMASKNTYTPLSVLSEIRMGAATC